MCIRLDKADGIIKICHAIRYIKLFNLYNEVYYGINPRKYNARFDRINSLITEKGCDKDLRYLKVLIIILEESGLIHIIHYL